MDGIVRQWNHSPTHLFVSGAAYFVTGRTYLKKHYFKSPELRTMVLTALFEQAEKFNWSLQAWAVLSNHYHFVAHAPEDALSLFKMLKSLHSKTARAVNAEDRASGRTVWFQYRDTCLTYRNSYYARLHYTHTNPVKHGAARAAEDYPWCSMSWFLREAEPGFRRTVLSFKCDHLSIEDDF